MQRTILTFGEGSAEVRALQNRHEREGLVLKLEGVGIDQQSLEGRRTINGLIALQYERERAATAARREYLRQQEDQLAAIQREIGLIGASAAEQARVNALAEAETAVREKNLTLLEAAEARRNALARAEAEATLSRTRAMQDLQVAAMMDGFDARIAGSRNPWLRADIEAERAYAQAIAGGQDAEVAAIARAQARARAISELTSAQDDFLRGQQESLQRQQLEIALIGQSAEVRARVLALVQAERDIQRLGATGEDAEVIRRNTLAQADYARRIEEQADAWRRVQSAGEQAIDGVLDKLREGDLGSAFREMISEIEQGFFDLAIRNPLKNMFLGTNLGTWEDVGGWAGIRDRFTGRASVDEAGLVRAATAMPLQSMTVTTSNVILGGNLSGLAGMMAGAANLNASPAMMGGLPGSSSVQAQIWSFFAGKGLASHQIAGVMGNASAESGFNPLAVGDSGNAFGLFQWNDRRNNLFDFIGGQQNLGDIQKQLQFAWHELMTSENGAYQKLLASSTVREATAAFAGFERPSGYTPQNPEGAMHFDRRLAAAEAAMGQFEAATVTAQQQLGQLGAGAAQLGTGLEGFGSSIAGVIQQAGAQRGIGGSLIGGLLTSLGGMIGIPGFARGGDTGSGADDDVAGVVHRNEYVFDAAATRRIGVANLEAIRRGNMQGYRSGGYVSGRAPMPGFAPGQSATGDQAGRERVVFAINVTGTGNAEVRDNVNQAIAQAFESYDRQALPDRVKMIVNDRWGS
ncbi:hypothetical protein H4P12_08475 [Paracoccus sp. 11-3]|uniref:Phage tail lysozyme domain-containing protein n=1 Tax=Paracoccus amoyensis TaxID=2760093 RepID=A0A926JB51_9RHOB|nr:phage tail tip lysozyme [Paracoccus amoyensis]MBC9246746.1 hypothetical protein [Paracoccus amoyensis]